MLICAIRRIIETEAESQTHHKCTPQQQCEAMSITSCTHGGNRLYCLRNPQPLFYKATRRGTSFDPNNRVGGKPKNNTDIRQGKCRTQHLYEIRNRGQDIVEMRIKNNE